ncbi:MAG: metallophosphoesterase [Pyrinomonadaceae bacterium]
MRRILHLSDIHFGTQDDNVVALVVAAANELKPHVVVVSGDLTQRARSREFEAARAFLDKMPRPQIVVPGNHDVPLYNIFDRFFRRLDKYQRYITSDLSPSFVDDEIAVLGINTARSMTIKGGRISEEQVADAQELFLQIPDNRLKVIVTHHPFDLPEGMDEDDIVGRAEVAMRSIANCGGEIFLSGHLHVSNIETSAKRYSLPNGRTALIVQAGTATSARVRGEPHSFNVIDFDSPSLRIARYERATDAGFCQAEEKMYLQTPHGWDRKD